MLAALLLSVLPSADPAGDQWTQWRGPARDGRTPVALPASLGEDALKEAWRKPLGASYSGPVTDGVRVYVTESVGNHAERVRALDPASGEILWEARWEGSLSVPFFAKANGDWIRSTPALAPDGNGGGTLFVAGMRDVLVALDAADGAEKWRVDFAARAGAKPEAFGHVASPLAVADETGGGAVYAHTIAGFSKLDAATGEVLWTVLGGRADMMSGGAFSSPVAATVAGVPQLVVQTRAALCGVAPADGAILWEQPVRASRGMNILTPTLVPIAGDGNGDGVRILTSSNGGGTTLFGVTNGPGGWATDTLWENARQGYMSSPVVVDGHAYQHLKSDRAVCFALTDGEPAWTTRPFGPYWSLVTDGARVLALDADGDLLLFPADPAGFELLGARHVTDATSWAHVAVAPRDGGGRIYVRALDELIAYDF